MKQTKKYVVLAIFALVIVVSVILFGSVKINYNISDYLDESTETKISLNIMENQFGTTGNIQVMVEDITVDQASQVYNIIKSVNNVLFVNFSETDVNYYKPNAEDGGATGDALFAVIVDGDEYSATSAVVLDDIKTGLDELFEGKTNYGGAVVEKIEMRNTMKKEIVLILAISVVFAMVIMLIMANSWIEPLVLLFSSGIAVLINMGTNAIFGEISYITNSVAAILQLALSIDYSIVLLHNFRAVKNEIADKHDAMNQAVKMTFKPVLASATTTIAGLLALLFMTMKIGFDIGIVLTKGIIISMLTSLTLLPALLLVCDKLMQKTFKRDLVITGKRFCKIAFKKGKAIVFLALAIIIACGGLQLDNTYSFTDTANPNQNIVQTFGSNNTIVVLYNHHGREDWGKENELAQKLFQFKTANGESVVQNYTAYSNTVRELYTIEMAAEKLNIPATDVQTLFALYHEHNNNPENRKLEPLEFIDFAIEFLTPAEGEDYKYADETTVRTLKTLSVIYSIVNNKHTAEELHHLVSTGVMEGTGLSLFQIKQMYGLYAWEKFDNGDVDFTTMLDFMVKMTEDEDAKTLMDEQTAADLLELSVGLVDFLEQMNTVVTKDEFLEFGRDKFGDAGWVELACNAVFALCNKDDGKAKIVDILKLVDGVSNFIPREFQAYIKNYTYVYDVIDDPCEYTEFLPRLKKVVLALTDEEREINASESAVQQAYIMYFGEKGTIPTERILGIEFIKFVNDVIETNPTVSGNVSEESKLKLKDVILVDKFVSDHTAYNVEEMTALLNKLQEDVKSITSSSDSLSSEDVYAIYIRYVAQFEENLADPIIAIDLLEYVDTYKDNPKHTLYKYMTEENKAKIEERKQAILNAENLFLGDEYNRMLISVDLPSEGAESSRFVQYLMQVVEDVYCEHAHVAGHIVSTYELQETFEDDNKLISIFTIVSIFVIIAVIFGSISLPVLLVTIIQGAIWISMSTSLLTGPMFFMSYIIATCILMGSTIDYGILMSTNYLDYRNTMNKEEALLKAVKSAMPTVFTSGLILTICGFIVGMVASMTSISTVGILLGKGTLVSMIMITVVLPSVLYGLDGFVIKGTRRKLSKEERKERREARKAKRLAKKEAKSK